MALAAPASLSAALRDELLKLLKAQDAVRQGPPLGTAPSAAV